MLSAASPGSRPNGSEGETAAAARPREAATGAGELGDDATGTTFERSSTDDEDMLFNQASEAGQGNRKKLVEQRLENCCTSGKNRTMRSLHEISKSQQHVLCMNVHQLTML